MADVLRQPFGAGQDGPAALAAGVDGAWPELLIRGDLEVMLGRRSLMIAGAATAAELTMGANLLHADVAAPIRYPDASFKVLDPRFQSLILGNAAVERIAGGCRFTEGPVWFGDGRFLLWSDIPNDRILKWEEETGAVSVFRKPSNYANGNTRDRQGRLITCEHDTQHVTRTEYDGTITVLAHSFEGNG
jgi:gluconolactonase